MDTFGKYHVTYLHFIFCQFGKDGHRKMMKIRVIESLKIMDMGPISIEVHDYRFVSLHSCIAVVDPYGASACCGGVFLRFHLAHGIWPDGWSQGKSASKNITPHMH